MTNELSEVEPPPWFKQKIMARVREEVQKKSLAQKWFYPLRIKVPVQVFATIFIVVIAVYIYRAGDEQLKEVIPPAVPTPVMEEQKEPMKKDLPAVVAERPDKQIVETDKSCEGDACKVNETVMQDSIGETLSAGKGKLEPRASAPPPPQKESVAEGETKETKSRLLRTAMEKTVSSVQIKQAKSIIILKESDIKTAAAQVEKIFARYNAKKVTKQWTDSKIVFSAELSSEKLKDFVAQLKTIGPVEEKNMPDDSAEGDIPLVIEILSN